MPVRITDLPNHKPEDNEIIHMASFDEHGITRRINVGEYVCETEEKAIEKVKEIYASGFVAFVMPFKV